MTWYCIFYLKEHKAKFEEYDIKKQGYININEIDETKVEIFKGMDLDNDGKVDLSGRSNWLKWNFVFNLIL